MLRLLCGGETFDGDYNDLNRFQRGKPAVHRCGDIVAKWIPPKNPLTALRKNFKPNQKKRNKGAGDDRETALLSIAEHMSNKNKKGHWLRGKEDNGHWVPGKEENGNWVPGTAEELSALDVVKSVLDLACDFWADFYFEIQLIGTLLHSESRAFFSFFFGSPCFRDADWWLLPMLPVEFSEFPPRPPLLQIRPVPRGAPQRGAAQDQASVHRPHAPQLPPQAQGPLFPM